MNMNRLVRQKTQRYDSTESVISVFTAAFLDTACVIEREKHYVAFNYLHNDNHSSLLLYRTLQDSKHTCDKGIPKGRKK